MSPPVFRQAGHSFDWEARRMLTELDGFTVWDVTFPSPVETPVAVNNTVHCEYYQTARGRARGRR